jgi:hypothetical protein
VPARVLVNAFTAPLVSGADLVARAASGENILTSPQMQKQATETTLSLLGSRLLPGNPLAPAGSLGMFGGVRAKKADTGVFSALEQYDAQIPPHELVSADGVFPGAAWVKNLSPEDQFKADDIYQQTGWFRGPDNKMRFHISDQEAKILGTDHVMDKLEVPVPLSSVLDHPELYEQYPFLKDIPVVRDDMSYYMHPRPKADNGLIGLDTRTSNPMDDILHEVQHAVQVYEDFSRGGGSSLFNNTLPEPVDRFNTYMKLTGERESQLVEEMKNNPEYEQSGEIPTAFVPYGDQLLRDYKKYYPGHSFTPVEEDPFLEFGK